MKKKLLVVDDEPHIVQVLSLKLRNAGYDVITASDGEEAYQLVQEEKPDLLVVDLQMPYMDGLELCKALAANKATAKIPVLILTARGFLLGNDDVKSSNICDILSKPFSPRSVLEQIQKILGSMDDKAGEDGGEGTSQAKAA